MCVLADGVMLGFLTYCGILDWKTREIPMWLLTLYSGVSVGLTFLLREERLGSIIVGFGIGVIFLLVSKMTKEAVGYGDSWIITILGVYLGGQRLIWILFLLGSSSLSCHAVPYLSFSCSASLCSILFVVISVVILLPPNGMTTRCRRILE